MSLSAKCACFGILSLTSLSGCLLTPPTPPKTQLEVRQFQSRDYRTADTKSVMKAMLNVLQDDGYVVKNAVLDLGLLTATKDMDVEDTSERIFSTLLMGSHATWARNAYMEATINVSDFGKESRVRANFQRKIMDNRGAILKIEPVMEDQFYTDFFSKVDKGLFIQHQKL